jgi:MFS superfamily sulfate permease-like transporter
MNILIKEFKCNFSASVVVFFVALPLCLGIALASGAPLFAGIIAGIVGGVVVGSLSGSQLGVSGPAAGMVAVVLNGISLLGSWSAFLMAVVLMGLIQLALGYLKAGQISKIFPTSVINGMLVGIGLMLIIKQIPHALGYDVDFEGSLSFIVADRDNSFIAIARAWQLLSHGAIFISIISILILIMWEKVILKKFDFMQWLQAPILVVILGVLINYLYYHGIIPFSLQSDQLVTLPAVGNFSDFLVQLAQPDFSQLYHFKVYQVAFLLALVGSLETLICVQATDKLDPQERITPINLELKAQGIGNIVCGLTGGLPVTQVIIRSSSNIKFGAKSKLSTILHGILMLVCVVTIADFLNKIPLASLAAILIILGYKLAKPIIFIEEFKQGWISFVPFFATILGIFLINLMMGIVIGLCFHLSLKVILAFHKSYS